MINLGAVLAKIITTLNTIVGPDGPFVKKAGDTMTGDLTMNNGAELKGNAATATKATQDGSGNNIVNTYTKKAGDTMTGQLVVYTGSFPPIISKINHESYPAGVGFQNNTNYLGAVAMITKDGPLVRYNSASSAYSTVLDTGTVKDYVIEQGVVSRTGSTNTDWYYRKWNNGTSECWTIATCATITSWSAWGGIYEANVGSYWNYPASLFTTQPTLLATPFLNASGFCGVEFYENSSASTYATRTPYMYVLRGATGGTSTPTLQLYAIGRWK